MKYIRDFREMKWTKKIFDGNIVFSKSHTKGGDMPKERETGEMIPVDLKGHKTQDDFEMNEDFKIIILGNDHVPANPGDPGADPKPRQKDRGDSFLVGELGD